MGRGKSRRFARMAANGLQNPKPRPEKLGVRLAPPAVAVLYRRGASLRRRVIPVRDNIGASDADVAARLVERHRDVLGPDVVRTAQLEGLVARLRRAPAAPVGMGRQRVSLLADLPDVARKTDGPAPRGAESISEATRPSGGRDLAHSSGKGLAAGPKESSPWDDDLFEDDFEEEGDEDALLEVLNL